MNNVKTISRCHDVSCPCDIKQKWCRRVHHFVKQNLRQTVAHLISQYNGGSCRIVLGPTVYRTLLGMWQRSRYPPHVPLLTKRHGQVRLHYTGNLMAGPWIRGRDLPGQMNHKIVIHHVLASSVRAHHLPDEQLVIQCTAGHTPVSVLLCFGGRAHGHLWNPLL